MEPSQGMLTVEQAASEEDRFEHRNGQTGQFIEQSLRTALVTPKGKPGLTQREPKHRLKLFLRLVQSRPALVRHLLKNLQTQGSPPASARESART